MSNTERERRTPEGRIISMAQKWELEAAKVPRLQRERDEAVGLLRVATASDAPGIYVMPGSEWYDEARAFLDRVKP